MFTLLSSDTDTILLLSALNFTPQTWNIKYEYLTNLKVLTDIYLLVGSTLFNSQTEDSWKKYRPDLFFVFQKNYSL